MAYLRHFCPNKPFLNSNYLSFLSELSELCLHFPHFTVISLLQYHLPLKHEDPRRKLEFLP